MGGVSQCLVLWHAESTVGGAADGYCDGDCVEPGSLVELFVRSCIMGRTKVASSSSCAVMAVELASQVSISSSLEPLDEARPGACLRKSVCSWMSGLGLGTGDWRPGERQAGDECDRLEWELQPRPSVKRQAWNSKPILITPRNLNSPFPTARLHVAFFRSSSLSFLPFRPFLPYLTLPSIAFMSICGCN